MYTLDAIAKDFPEIIDFLVNPVMIDRDGNMHIVDAKITVK